MGSLPAALAGLASAFTWGTASLLFGRLLRSPSLPERPTAPAANLFKNALALAVFALAWPLLGAGWPGEAATAWLVWSGFLGFAVGDSLYFAALPRSGVQAAAMIGQLNVPLAALLAWLLLGERLGAVALGSMALVLVGVTLVVAEPARTRAGAAVLPHDPRVRRAGLVFAFLNAACQATSIVVGRRGFGDVPLLGGTIARLLGGTLGALALALAFDLLRPRRTRASRVSFDEVRSLVRPLHARASWRPLFPAALFGSVLGLLPFHYAMRELPGGISAVLFATTPLFTLPLGLFFDERQGWRGWLGTGIGFVGVAGVLSAL